MPPVAKTAMPWRWARWAVAATVVPALRPRARRAARFQRLALSAPPLAKASISSGVRPTRTSPRTRAMVLGMAPSARTASSRARAVFRLSG
jgi:hypothetical protein